MGRKSDPDQALKGYPNKRKSKADKAVAEAERLAKLLAAIPPGGDPLAAPAFINHPQLKAAAQVWADYAPELKRLNLLETLDRISFAMLCIYTAEFFAANEDIIARGYSVMVKTVSGDKMPRKNPSVERRERAFDAVMELSQSFGLTPLHRYSLFKDQARSPLGGLFGDHGRKPEAEADGAAAPAPAKDNNIGLLYQMDSQPPGERPN